MNMKGISLRNKSLWAMGLAALLAVGTPAFAQHGGGGGGGHGGGGGGGSHGGGGGGGFHGGGGGGGFHGGGGHVGGFSGGHASGFGGRPGGFGGGGFVGSRPGFAGSRAYVGGGVHYAPRVGYSPAYRGGVSAVHGHVGTFVGRNGYVGHAGHGYGWGRGGFGWHRPYWGGGYWGGGYWPRAYYGWSYPWFLGVLPAVYATYWWGGVPYYYANDVYYTWNGGQNGYVVTDPPPVDTGEDTGSAGNGTYDSAEPGDVQSNSYSSGAGGSSSNNVYAYPKDGQSDEQQSTDRYECHKWAVAQSGFDPTQTSRASGSAPDYRRAMTACLDGRGYSAK